LVQHLPPDLKPYRLLGIWPIKRSSRQYIWCAGQWGIFELGQAVRQGWGEIFFDLWVWSQRLTPDLPTDLRDEENTLSMLCSANGLVAIQRGLTRDAGLEPFALGITHKIFNPDAGRVVTHTGYLQIFDALRKAIRKKLVYSSIRVFPDGTRLEDTRLQRMTAAAVKAYKSGVRFANLPGRYLGPMK